jgi:hypothetical protein
MSEEEEDDRFTRPWRAPRQLAVAEILAAFMATPPADAARKGLKPVEMQLVATDEGVRVRISVALPTEEVHWTYASEVRPHADYLKERQRYRDKLGWTVVENPAPSAAIEAQARAETG